MTMMQTRRRFLTTMSLAGAAGLLHLPPAPAAEGVLETTAVRLNKNPGVCIAPLYFAEELLRTEGFTDVVYVEIPTVANEEAVASGKVDFAPIYAPLLIPKIEAGVPVTVLAGIMVGCFELFGNAGIRGIADLKGKTVGVQDWGSTEHVLVTLMAAHVGLDPVNDIRWVTDPAVKPIELFVEGKIEAFLGLPPQPQDLRARHIGHVIVNSAVDRPWSDYFCCMLLGNREYVQTHPVATKRVLRAILKATDLCATQPARVARQIVDRGFTPRYDYALQTLRENGYDKWREYDVEDTIRFYALRLYELGWIKSSPQKIIADGTNWRFLNELKQELRV
jgi:NitT/TauT family transport system substrate-binding protein